MQNLQNPSLLMQRALQPLKTDLTCSKTQILWKEYLNYFHKRSMFHFSEKSLELSRQNRSIDIAAKYSVNSNVYDARMLRKSIRLERDEASMEIKESSARKAMRVYSGSAIVSLFTRKTTYHSWNNSKELCPSGYNGPGTRTVSTSSFRFYSSRKRSSNDDITSCNESTGNRNSCGKNKLSEGRCNEDPSKIQEDTYKHKSKSDEYCAQRSQDKSNNSCLTTEESKPSTYVNVKRSLQDYCSTNSSATSSLKDPCEKPCSLTACSIPKLLCPPPRLQDLYPTPDEKVLKCWRIFCLVFVMPTIALASVWFLSKHDKEAKEPRPPYLDVPYLHIRTKRFPWGDGNHSFFHNPIKNPVPPDGYEVDDPYAVKKTNGDPE